MDIWLWCYARAALSKNNVSTLKNSFEVTFSLLVIGMIQSHIFFLMWTGLPSSGSSRVPPFGSISLGYGTSHIDKLTSLWVIPWHDDIIFFIVIILALFFKLIFKLTFKYVQSSPFSKQSLLESTIEVSNDLFKTSMFKNDLKSICMYGMNTSL